MARAILTHGTTDDRRRGQTVAAMIVASNHTWRAFAPIGCISRKSGRALLAHEPRCIARAVGTLAAGRVITRIAAYAVTIAATIFTAIHTPITKRTLAHIWCHALAFDAAIHRASGHASALVSYVKRVIAGACANIPTLRIDAIVDIDASANCIARLWIQLTLIHIWAVKEVPRPVFSQRRGCRPWGRR
jgi:hypothetical protein